MGKENALRVGIMQPYFLPYLGYFQLIQKCDIFVLYDDVQFTKKGWISRNYLRSSANAAWSISLPTLASKTETLIREKKIAQEFAPDSIFSRIQNDYGRNLNFQAERDLLWKILSKKEKNLFRFLKSSITETLQFLDFGNPQILTSSEIGDFTGFKGESKVIAILSKLGAHSYLNPISGQNLYNTETFLASGIFLEFFKPSIPDSYLCGNQPLSIFHGLITQGREQTKRDSFLGGIVDGRKV